MRTTAVRSQGGPKSQLSVAKDVLLDGWNLLQVTSASLVLIACLLFLFRLKIFTPVALLASFTMWIELLYFLRAFEFSGGLVRMVFKVRRHCSWRAIRGVALVFNLSNSRGRPDPAFSPMLRSSTIRGRLC